MNVTHVIAPGRIAGAERVVLGGTAALRDAGIGVVLAVLADDRCPEHGAALVEEAERLGVPTSTVTTAGRVDLRAARALRAVISAAAPAMLHVHGYKALAYSRLASPRRPVVATHHGGTAHDGRARLYERLTLTCYRTPAVSHVVAVGARVRDQLEAAGVPAARLSVVPNFVSSWVPESDREEPGADGGTQLLALGRLSVEKGLDVLLDALASGDVPPWSLTVVGDGPERAALQAQVDRLDLGPRVTFVGHCADVLPWIARSHVLVMPSRREGLPMSLLECVASGLPVVASRVGSIDEVVVDGESARLVPAGDPRALAEALSDVVTTLPARSEAARATARRVLADYSSAAWARRTLAVYERVDTRRAA